MGTKQWCPGRESYATTDTRNRCLSLVWWRECLARWRRFATWREHRPFCGSAKLATVAPWLALKNRGAGMCRPTCHSTTSTTIQRRALVMAQARPSRRQAKRDRTIWTMTDDWPEDVPVTEAEIEVFEAWFGDLFSCECGPSAFAHRACGHSCPRSSAGAAE